MFMEGTDNFSISTWLLVMPQGAFFLKVSARTTYCCSAVVRDQVGIGSWTKCIVADWMFTFSQWSRFSGKH